ncbi:MAG: response regulator transcription factor [Anaeromicrobium sp.]|jgi:DNA-binding response OmpR family regulator|uniref:response regulator transcription factor n=1 Tax=Anaeromicrobium sp. TaxID=1929132 RepID=UPI0025FAF7C8|nr:response regulator transcription factor [Anaeromicrobium sp.]MCT4596114.1 response regulator transcription factor [Anaeromicrobium sp.]
MEKILIVEDDSSISSVLRVAFKCSGFEVMDVATGEEGLELVEKENPDVVLLDVMLPGVDGFYVCDQLRKKYPNIGIIMLTAKSQDIDKINGLEKGADDYVVKPFNPTELILRVKALLRRSKKEVHEGEAILESKPFKIDIYSKKVYKNNVELDLTPKEYELMKIFIQNPQKAFSREELLKNVWGWEFVGESKNVDVHIRRLRKKVEDTSSEPEYIETVWGTGYRWKG